MQKKIAAVDAGFITSLPHPQRYSIDHSEQTNKIDELELQVEELSYLKDRVRQL